jgi:hypothetical protein
VYDQIVKSAAKVPRVPGKYYKSSVHEELCQQTLHLAVAFIDKFLVVKGVKLQLLQLLGITCLFIAAKYVERFPPEAKFLVYLENITRRVYDQIVKSAAKVPRVPGKYYKSSVWSNCKVC